MIFDYGVYSVIPTFFSQGNVNYVEINNLISFQIKSGIKNIVLLGTTSETPTLSDEEQNEIVKNVWENFHGKVNIIVGIGGNNTKSTIEKGLLYNDLCDAFMVTVPYYNKPSQEGMYEHFSSIAKVLNSKNLLLYNVPSRCGVSISSETVVRLYNSHENIKAIKEASGNVSIAQEILNKCEIVVLSGDDSLTLPIMSIGGKGVVSVASNIIPNYILKLVELFKNGDISNAIKINNSLFGLFKVLFIEPNPIPLKYILKKLNFCNEASVRLPLVEITSYNNLEKIQKEIKPIINHQLHPVL